jgi:hypothetical protein
MTKGVAILARMKEVQHEEEMTVRDPDSPLCLESELIVDVERMDFRGDRINGIQ